MGAMIGGVAHELNNPLTSILGVSELLQDSQTTELGAKANRHIAATGAPRGGDCAQPDLLLAPPAPGKTRVNLAELSSAL
jgi:signal transduction histidine kinase